MTPFYSTKALVAQGLPHDVAQKVVDILMHDDPELPNLGRSETDIHFMRSVQRYLSSEQ